MHHTCIAYINVDTSAILRSHCFIKVSRLLQSFLVAVVIPEKKELQSFAKQQGISGDYKDLLKNDKANPQPPPDPVCHLLSVDCHLCDVQQVRLFASFCT